MELTSKRKPFMDYIIIMIGTTLLAAGLNMFFVPLNLVTGGVTGLAIIIKELTTGIVPGGVELWITNLIINIPLFLLAVAIKGKGFGGRSLFATVFLSIALIYTGKLPVATNDMLLGCVFGGVLAGAGLGLVFSAYSTTGGTDLAASIIQNYMKHISVAQIMFFLDAVIITAGYFIFGIEKAMYAIVAVFITAKVVDAMLEGIHFSKAAFIISGHNEEIAKEIMAKLERGVTGLNGNGKFSKESKEVLLCVVSKKEIVRLKEITRDIDKKAFVIVADVREVVGEGFIEYN
ncbi:YitT family protein [Vallitalea pronyensis]|uniref:YitT family protein n=1 Tax=Vallitalea pronyensis TaxID=1348613 RepID=A0A8J8SII5_9FIRM|nr:YitT family protein [Vallitalea pronyensis]QUI24970.1 YitT family protein [Vallitalea pronyensis]